MAARRVVGGDRRERCRARASECQCGETARMARENGAAPAGGAGCEGARKRAHRGGACARSRGDGNGRNVDRGAHAIGGGGADAATGGGGVARSFFAEGRGAGGARRRVAGGVGRSGSHGRDRVGEERCGCDGVARIGGGRARACGVVAAPLCGVGVGETPGGAARADRRFDEIAAAGRCAARCVGGLSGGRTGRFQSGPWARGGAVYGELCGVSSLARRRRESWSQP